MSPVFTPSSRYAGYPLDLPGATAATRYVGATASGAPASGSFAVGDFIIDQTGAVYVCTVAGSPGTWTLVTTTPGSTVLYDSTLGGAAASIDTGANGVAQTASGLLIVLYTRTAEVTAVSTLAITFNADGGANYDTQVVQGAAAAAAAAQTTGATSVNCFTTAGASATASVFGAHTLTIPAYRQTTGFKSGAGHGGLSDATAANSRIRSGTFQWRSTAAITRVAVSVSGGSNLAAGSRMTIYGLT